MPALWQSSQRPMYIRTVWVDGFRHAILTHDDPHFLKLCARRRPQSSTSYIKQRQVRGSVCDRDKIDELRKLHFVIKSHKRSDTDQVRHTENIEKLNLSNVDSSEEDDEDDVSPRIYDLDTKVKLDRGNMRATKTTRTARNEVKENTELSDRVLQWLDLAGKIDLLAPNNAEISQPRHSWPEIQRRNLVKSKTATELRPKEIKSETKQSGNIDRPELYLPTSANTIENYAKQSRNLKITQRHDVKKVKDARMNIIEARQKIATERNAIEKQYSDLMSKKQIPDHGKTRKQVHIFMPAAISKKAGSNSTSRTESLVSQAQ